MHVHLHCNSFLKKIEVPNFHKQETSEKILNNIQKFGTNVRIFIYIAIVFEKKATPSPSLVARSFSEE